MKTKLTQHLLAALLGIVFTTNLHAQLVPDGGTLVVTTPTDISPSDLVVGANAGNTLLTILAPGTVTNATGFIGYNAASTNNQVRIENSGAVWQNSGNLVVGYNGSGNQLMVNNGGMVADGFAYIAGESSSSNNVAVVTGTGSLWINSNYLYVGDSGSANQLLVSNGAVVANITGLVGNSPTANNNVAMVTGAGSLWTNSAELDVGYSGSGNQLVVSNGAVVVNTTGDLGIDPNSRNNLAVVTGTGSRWMSSGDLSVGQFSSGNQLLVSNGAVVANITGLVGNNSTASSNVAMVTGTGSLWTNSAELYVGYLGSGNQLMVSKGGVVADAVDGIIGFDSSSSNNLAVVTGTGSLLTNSNDLIVGDSGSGNQLMVSNGAVAANITGLVGNNSTASSNVAMVTGTGSLWTNTGDLYVGYSGFGNHLMVSNAGMVANYTGHLGFDTSSSNNVAMVTGTGSLWTNSHSVFVGDHGSGNQLVVSNGGVVTANVGSLGYISSSSNNVAVVTGTGSRWNNFGGLSVGQDGSKNQLVVSDGGLVAAPSGFIGVNPGSGNNVAMVTGTGSLWNNSRDLYVGYAGSGNQLVANDGGTVQAVGVYVGLYDGSTNNRTTVDGGNLIVTNSGGTGSLDIRRGTNVLNAGLIQADNLLVTNSAGFFEFNGGTLITSGGTVNNGQPFVVGASGTTAAILDVRSNTPLVLNKYFTLGANTAPSGNQLLVTNGGVLSGSGTAYIGLTASNNQIVVDGTGSSWTSSGNLLLGDFTAGNRLTVGGGGVVADVVGQIGNISTANNNLAVVRDAGSLWNNSSALYVGVSGSGNQLVVSNGAVVAAPYGLIGFGSSSSNNLAVVTGAGSLWANSTLLFVGQNGSENQLVASDAGTIQAADAYLGFDASSTKNRVTVDGGNLIVTNSDGTAVLDVRRGTNVFNAGLIQADNLLLTNSAGFFEFNGGTLITSGSTVDNGQAFVVGNGSSSATLNLNGNGLHTFNNGLVISSAATLKGNGTVAGPLTVQSGGTVMPGNSVGTLVLSNSPALQGSVLMEISKTGATLTSDQIQVAAPLTYGGNLAVSKLGSDALAIGDSFRLFSAPSYGGAFTGMSLPPLDSSLMWTNKLLLDGSIAVVQRPPPTISGVMKSGTNLVFNVSGGAPGGAYDVLTSTNVALPLSTWTTNSTGFFDALGTMTITRGINPAEPQRFFTISEP